MKKIYLFIAFLPIYANCQNTIGFPDIINYSKQSYSGGLQNWHIKQDKLASFILPITKDYCLLMAKTGIYTLYRTRLS